MAITEMVTTSIESIKNFWNSFDLRTIAERIGGSSSEAILSTVYFGIFFAVGILFKKYFKFFFSCIFVSAILIKLMEYNGLLTINWAEAQVFIGISSTQDINAIINELFLWGKTNVFLLGASVIGFLIGYKLG